MAVSKEKPSLDDLRRLNGYLIITFTSIFLYFPVVWLMSIWSVHPGIYTKWLVISGLICLINVGFYFWRYPVRWLANLLVLALIDALLMVYEYLWIMAG